MENKINISINWNNYFLNWDIESIINNRRLLISFKRLNYTINNNLIIIPFLNENKIFILDELRNVLIKFNYEIELDSSIKEELSSYNKEQENFLLFSLKAKKIRNSDFSDSNELIEDFKNFKELLEITMKRTLYPLQMLSSFHMAFSQNSCNFSVPWAWKTSIVYWAFTYLKNLPKEDPKHVDKLLIIWPLSSFAPWENEYNECFWVDVNSQRLSWNITISKKQKKEHLYSTSPKELTLVSHWWVDLFEKEILDFLKQNKVMVIVDEAHKIKNPNWVWGKSVVEISKEAVSRVILTWTPVPNWYEDLFNLYRFIYPYKYKDILKIHYDQLKELTKNQTGSDDNRVKNFIENINPYFIRIKKKDLQLPKVNNIEVFVDMDPSQREIYDFIEEKYIKSFSDNSNWTVKDILNKAKLIRLRQAATNPKLLLKVLKDTLENSSEIEKDPNLEYAIKNNATIDDSEIFSKIVNISKNNIIPNKFKKIEEIVKKIEQNNWKVIIWTIFIQNAEELKDYLTLKWIKSELLIGKILQEDREVIIKKFNDTLNSEFKVVVANPFSVSESISLHKWCHNAIYMERDYNCSNFLQSKDRIHRVWLENWVETNYYYIISKDSIDTVIDTKLNEKVKRMEKIIDEDIPLFKILYEEDETDIIKSLLSNYARRTKKV